MTGIMIFETKHGNVAIEIEESDARKQRLAETQNVGRVPKAALAVADKDGGSSDVIVKAPISFGDAMSTLKSYAANLEDLVADMPFAPHEVSVEIGLKLAGSAGFIIAKAGAETEMKVSMTWKPRT